jgi:hypothetical protein
MYNRRHRQARRSSALVITLAVLVLLSSLLLVFFDLGQLNRQISFSSAGEFRADTIAHAAIDTTIGDLQSEMQAGSTVTNDFYGTGTNLLIPLTNQVNPTVTNLYMVPARVGDQGFTNLVTQSMGSSNFWSTTAGYGTTVYNPIRASSGNSTANTSLNGRYIALNRWNKPGLLADPGSGKTPNPPATTYVPPDWVIVTRQGPVTNAPAGSAAYVKTLADNSPSNLSYAVGRYAYTIYNEGALFDVNVGGLPTQGSSKLTGTQFNTERGLLPQVDLAALLSSTAIGVDSVTAEADADALVQWRNAASIAATSYANPLTNGYNFGTNGYIGHVETATNGFTSVNFDPANPKNTDQSFLSRQDLIDYIKNSGNAIPTTALPFLATFTLDSDQPSYSPDPARPKVSTTQDDITNPNVLTLKVPASGFPLPRASDQTPAVAGEPLLKHRFPLSRLALFQNPTANAALILKYFCMKPHSGGLWDYVDPDSGSVASAIPTIKTLDQVASVGKREPTFWELLQAGILTGSLGSSLTATSQTGMDESGDASATRQIFRIGLSIMDQYDADDIPTVINFGGIPWQGNAPTAANMFVAGVENLPYIMWITQQSFQDDWVAPDSNNNSTHVGYLMFGLWNPHRNAATGNANTFELHANGKTGFFVGNATGTSGTPPTANLGMQDHNDSIIQFRTVPSIASPSSARTFAAVDVLRASDVIGTPPDEAGYFSQVNNVNGNKTKSLLEPGFLMGRIQKTTVVGTAPFGIVAPGSVPPLSATPPNPLDFAYNGSRGTLTTRFDMVLGIKDSNGNFIPYQAFPNYNADFGNNSSDPVGYKNLSDTEMYHGLFDAPIDPINPDTTRFAMGVPSAHSDPRTNRFGFQVGNAASMEADNFSILDVTGSQPKSLGGWSIFNSGNLGSPFSPFTKGALADLTFNRLLGSTGDTYSSYTDPDYTLATKNQIARQGDSNPPPGFTKASYATHGIDSPYTYSRFPNTTGMPGALSIPTDAQPIMLNRPFTSVAEMGYAFRDDPWRTLNFSSYDSADGGLLDFFCLNENDSATRAGVVDINNASVELLTALLMNAYRDPVIPTTGASNPAGSLATPNATPPLALADATKIAQGIRTALGPVNNPTMVLRNVADLPLLITKMAKATPSPLPDTFKYKREAIVRALADIMNTRTWNLMIDVIAQSGRYPTTATTLDNFVVEGERRYWVHVAIDRFTGRVTASRVEPVTE